MSGSSIGTPSADSAVLVSVPVPIQMKSPLKSRMCMKNTDPPGVCPMLGWASTPRVMSSACPSMKLPKFGSKSLSAPSDPSFSCTTMSACSPVHKTARASRLGVAVVCIGPSLSIHTYSHRSMAQTGPERGHRYTALGSSIPDHRRTPSQNRAFPPDSAPSWRIGDDPARLWRVFVDELARLAQRIATRMPLALPASCRATIAP